jgi:hypothetical protein
MKAARRVGVHEDAAASALPQQRRTVLIRHARVNRIAARVSYIGPRLRFGMGRSGGWALLLDARVYQDVHGWKGLLSR